MLPVHHGPVNASPYRAAPDYLHPRKQWHSANQQYEFHSTVALSQTPENHWSSQPFTALTALIGTRRGYSATNTSVSYLWSRSSVIANVFCVRFALGSSGDGEPCTFILNVSRGHSECLQAITAPWMWRCSVVLFLTALIKEFHRAVNDSSYLLHFLRGPF
jgi:hypothetical protein